LLHDVELVVETDRSDALDYRDWMHALVDINPAEELLDGLGLRYVVQPNAGVNDVLRQKLVHRPHLKLYNSHFNAAFVAQHAVALLLACANRIVEGDAQMRGGTWKPFDTGFASVDLVGKTCLLLGYGAIGREIKWRVEGLGMSVSILKSHPEDIADLPVYGPNELFAALAGADVTMVSLPGTEETEGFLSQEAFDAMRPGAILVNVGRGTVIDQHALYLALEKGRLASAGLDVWWNYPRFGSSSSEQADVSPADVLLHKLPNVVMSPHRAAIAGDWQEQNFRDVAATLNALAQGDERNRVELERGY
jgi:D-3-phosphoglycerate dehydrogenase